MWIFEKGARGGKKNAQEKCPKKKMGAKNKRRKAGKMAFLWTVSTVSTCHKCLCCSQKRSRRNACLFLSPNTFWKVRYQATVQKIWANLDAFQQAVTGEWKGFEALFDPETGSAIEVPLTSLPDEFLDWNVKPLGYESWNSTVVRNHQLYRKHSRILPSVSFDADTVDLETEIYRYNLQEEEGFLFLADGSYSKGPVSFRDAKVGMPHMFEFCLVASSGAPMRYLFRFSVDIQRCKLWGDVQVFLEYRDGEFCDGNAIASGSGFTEGFSSDMPLSENLIQGEWYPKSVQYLYPSGYVDEQPLGPIVVDKFASLPRQLVLLPGNVYVKCNCSDEQSWNLEVGHVSTEGRWISFHRKYVDDRLILCFQRICCKA